MVAGTDTEVQYNKSGAFGADANFTWNYTGQVLTINGTLAIENGAPLMQIDVEGGFPIVRQETGGDKWWFYLQDSQVNLFGGTNNSANSTLQLNQGTIVLQTAQPGLAALSGPQGSAGAGTMFSAGIVTPSMYGGDPTGAVDSTTAVTRAIRSGKVCVLDGKYLINGNITVNVNNTNGVCIIGGGGVMSQLLYGTNGAQLTFVFSSYSNPIGGNAPMVTLRDFTAQALGQWNSSTAIVLQGVAESGSSTPCFAIDNVSIMGSDGSNYFQNGIILEDVRYGTIRGCNIQGQWSSQSSGCNGNGITFTNNLANSAPIVLTVSDNHLAYWHTGILIEQSAGGSTGTNAPEGIYIHHNDMLACYDGVSASCSDGSTNWVQISGCNISFGQYGVLAQNCQTVFITDNYFLATYMGSASAVGVQVNGRAGPVFGSIINNMVDFQNVTGSITTRDGIITQNGTANSNNIVHSNQTYRATTPFVIASGDQTGVGTGGGYAY